jgi:Flp pilus assembly CpaE family ATPase
LGRRDKIGELAKKPFAKPVVGLAYDVDAAEKYLEQYADVSEVITGFDLQYAVDVAGRYPKYRIYAVLDESEITLEAYAASITNSVQIISTVRAAEALAAGIGRPGPAAAYEQRSAGKRQESACIAVTGIKGGTGKTAFSSSVAALIAHEAMKKKKDFRVCFADCDVEGSRTGGMWFGVEDVPQSITLWAEMNERPEWNDLDKLLIYHEESGLWILPGPQGFGDAIRTPIGATITERLITSLRWHFDLIVLDMGLFQKNDAAYRAMQLADKTFLVFEPTRPVLKLMDQLHQENILGQLGVDLARLELVVNYTRSFQTTNISEKDVEEQFGMPVGTVISVDQLVLNAENAAVPPTLYAPASPFSLEIAKVCHGIVGDLVGRPAKASMLSLLHGKLRKLIHKAG